MVIGNSREYAGGIVGISRPEPLKASVLNCYNIGKIKSMSPKFGGIVGFNWGGTCIIKNVYTSETTAIAGGKYVGNILIDNGIVMNTDSYDNVYMQSEKFVQELNQYIEENKEDMNLCDKWKKNEKQSSNKYPIFEWQ